MNTDDIFSNQGCPLSSRTTFQTEDRYMIPFFAKQPVSIEKGRPLQFCQTRCPWKSVCGVIHPGRLLAGDVQSDIGEEKNGRKLRKN
jgi:hypothetical protein